MYRLGNGIQADDPEEAAEQLLVRDFPRVADGTLEEAIFVPDLVVPKHPEVLDYPIGKPKDAKEGLLAGEETERLALDEIKKYFKENKEPTFVIKDYQYKTTGEGGKLLVGDIDFVIVLPSRGTIFIFECKKTLNKDILKKAVTQIDQAELFLDSDIFASLVTGPKWSVVKKVLCKSIELGRSDQRALCINELASWLKPKSEAPSVDCFKDSFKMIVRQLVVQMLSKRITFTWDKSLLTSKVVENFKASEDSVYFLTNEQHGAVMSEAKFALIMGDFGTGKTITLREKALRVALASPTDKVYFVIKYSVLSRGGEDHELREVSEEYHFTLLEYQLMKYFESKSANNITVMSWRPTEDESGRAKTECLVKLMAQHNGSHFFIDEMGPRRREARFPYHDASADSDERIFDREFLAACLERAKTFFVAMNADYGYFSHHGQSSVFHEVEMRNNLRNSKGVGGSAGVTSRIPYKAADGRVLSRDMCAMEWHSLTAPDLEKEHSENMGRFLKTMEAAYDEMRALSCADRTADPKSRKGLLASSTSVAILFHSASRQAHLMNQVYDLFEKKLGSTGAPVCLFASEENCGRVDLIRKGSLSRFSEEHGGLLVTDTPSCQGVEFPNVILVWNYNKGDVDYNDASPRNAMLRAVVNLKVVRLDKGYGF